MRLTYPKTVGLIFESGSIVVAGAKNNDDLNYATYQYAKNIKKFNLKFNQKKLMLKLSI